MQSPPGNDQDEGEFASIVPEEWSTAGRDSERSEHFAGLRPGAPLLHAPTRTAGFKNAPLASDRPSIARRLFRGLTRFFIAVLIGVGATLGWQSHGDEAKEMVSTWVPTLNWLLSVSTTNSPSDVRVAAQDAALSQPPPPTQTPAPGAAATSSELARKLEPMSRDLAIVLRNLQQLAAEQEQMAQELHAVEQDIRQKVLLPPQSEIVPIPRSRPRKPTEQSSAAPPLSVRPPAPARQPLQ